MSDRPIQLTELFVQKANEHRIHELRCKLEGAQALAGPEANMEESGDEAGPDLPEDAKKSIQAARSHALDLLDRLGEDHDVKLQTNRPSPADAALELTQSMDSVREELPGNALDTLAHFEVWNALSSVIIEVAEPYLRNLFLFKCAVLMARADGEISSVESNFLHSLADKIGLPVGQSHRIIQNGATVNVSDFRGDPEDAFQTLHQLYLCALADGVVQGSEKRMLRRIATTLGIPDSEVDELIYNRQVQNGVDALDTGALHEYLLSLSDLPQNAYLPKDMSPEKLDEIKTFLDMPPQEPPFLIYENRFLDELLECAALTGNNLWAAPADEKPQSIQISTIEEWYFGMRSTQIRLDDGREIRFSRDARECFQLIRECLNNVLSSI